MDKNTANYLNWVLRIGVAGTFIGHGILAVGQKEDWVHFLTFWGFSVDTSMQLLVVIGVLDILVGVITLVRPWKPALLYAAIWAFLAALMRPITGDSILEFVERSANWAAPLALYLLLLRGKN